MRKVANVLQQLGEGMRRQGVDDGVSTLLINTAHEIREELDPN